MKIFAQVDNNSNLIRVFRSQDLESAQVFVGNIGNSNLVDVTDSNKCENFFEVAQVYVADEDSLMPAKIFPSWVLSADKTSWIPPVEQVDTNTIWDEESKSWVLPNS